MKNKWRLLTIRSLFFVLAFMWGTTAELRAATSTLGDVIAEGRKMVEDVYAAIQKQYVEPVHPHSLLVSAALGIKKQFNDESLLQRISGEIRLLHPVTRQPYPADILESDAREALHALYAYAVNTHGREGPLAVAYAMAGQMAEGLDAHSRLMTPEEYQELKTQAEGKLTGIGVELSAQDNQVRVIAPIEGSPAYRSGIRSGDVILKVDGQPVVRLRDAVNMIRGPVGTPIVITITRPGQQAPFELRLIREIVPLVRLKSVNLEPEILYVRLSQFNEETSKILEGLLHRARQSGSSSKGMIIDLRDNPGGLLSHALASTDCFIRNGPLLVIRGRTPEKERQFFANEDGIEENFPLVVLINRGSAASAEVMAGALRARGRALLMGEVSFGKGSVQTITELSGGYALRVTTNHYELPGGRKIDRVGLQPDIMLSTHDDATKGQDLYGRAVPAAWPAKEEIHGRDQREDASKQARQGEWDAGRLTNDPAVGRALRILKRTRSAQLKDMIAADPGMEMVAASPAYSPPAVIPSGPSPVGDSGAPPSKAIQPRLFVLSVGVSRYRESRLSLAFAEKDARSLAQALGLQGKFVFREVRTLVLVDEAVSRESILSSIHRFLGEAVSSDVVLIFVAGHGLKRSATNTFYFLPHEADHNNLTTKGLRWSDFEEELTALGARVKNVILMLDTCHSGALRMGMRGIAVTPDLPSAFGRKGTYVLAAAGADEAAVEDRSWGHGAFTRAILSGLEGGADYNRDRIVDVIELFHYVEAAVAEMTGGLQHPHFQMGGGALPLFSMR